MSIIDPAKLEAGYVLAYVGAYGVDAELKVFCSPGINHNIINHLDQRATYSVGSAGTDFIYTTETELACAHKFLDPVIPQPPTPTGPPAPDVPQDFFLHGVTNDGLHVIADLRTLPTVGEMVYVGYDKYYEKNYIFLSPRRPVKCPSEYDCSDYDVANAWKCFTLDNKKKCFPVGDVRFGVIMQWIEDGKPESGVSINYEGGFGGYEIDFHISCNYTVPRGDLHFGETGVKYPSTNNIVIQGDSSDICPRDIIVGVTGGSVFLLIVACLVFLYIMIGFIVKFLVDGSIIFPHAAFFNEFWICLQSGFIFIFTCGKERGPKNANYDNI
jgi:hypothetical protein